MIKYMILLSLVLNLCANAVTTEVVMVYQALSFHGTDQLGDSGVLKEPIQADVLSVPMALSGAFPEVLVSAVAKPHQMASIGSYAEKEANLVVLNKLRLMALQENGNLSIKIDVSAYEAQEDIEPGPRETLTLLIVALRKTLQQWGSLQPEKLKVFIDIVGVKTEQAFLKELVTDFTIGGGK